MAVWNFENAAHLLRRAGFGGSVEQIQEFLDGHSSVADAVTDLLDFASSNKKPPKGGNDFYRATIKQRQWWLKTMLKATNPKDALREKMVLFWHGHLCSGYSKQPDASVHGHPERALPPLRGRELPRPRARVQPRPRQPLVPRRHPELRRATTACTSPPTRTSAARCSSCSRSASRSWPPTAPTTRCKPNYTENDVHQLARALTGWV